MKHKHQCPLSFTKKLKITIELLYKTATKAENNSTILKKGNYMNLEI